MQGSLQIKPALIKQRRVVDEKPTDIDIQLFFNLRERKVLGNEQNKVYAGALRTYMVCRQPSLKTYINVGDGGNASAGVGEGAGSTKDELKNPFPNQIRKEIIYPLGYLYHKLNGLRAETQSAKQFETEFQTLANILRIEPNNIGSILNKSNELLDWLENLGGLVISA